MLFTKEHYDLMAQFERDYKYRRLEREKDKALWGKLQRIYENAKVNNLFLAYRKGYALGKISGEAAEKLAAAPIAMMDTRPPLSICALKEEDFPALYALQGKRVALVVAEN
jgi:hypothetical protein